MDDQTPQDRRSLVPHYQFAATLAQQEEQLRTNPMLQRFQASRPGEDIGVVGLEGPARLGREGVRRDEVKVSVGERRPRHRRGDSQETGGSQNGHAAAPSAIGRIRHVVLLKDWHFFIAGVAGKAAL